MASRQSHSGLRLLDRYTLEESLAEGGLATVYRGQDTVLRRSVVVKAVPPELVAAYRTALQTTAAFTHPAVVATYDAVEHIGWLFLVQEYVQARPLSAYFRDGVPSERAIDLAGQLARALAYAHAHDILHGDLTPPAVLVDRRAIVRINNFGLPLDTAYFTQVGHDADISLSLMRASATDAADPVTVDGEARDVRALGLLLWQLLAEHHIPSSSGVQQSRAFRKDVPEALRELVRRCVLTSQRGGERVAADVAVELEQLGKELATKRPKIAEQTPPALRVAREAVAREAAWSVEETLGGMRQWVAPQLSDSISPTAPTVESTIPVPPWQRSQPARTGAPQPHPATWPPSERAQPGYGPRSPAPRGAYSPSPTGAPSLGSRHAVIPDRFWVLVVLAGLTLFALFFLLGYFGPYLLGHHS